MTGSKKITEGALLTAVYIALLWMTVFITVISMFTFFALAISFIIYTANHNWQHALIIIIFAFILYLLFVIIFLTNINYVYCCDYVVSNFFHTFFIDNDFINGFWWYNDR